MAVTTLPESSIGDRATGTWPERDVFGNVYRRGMVSQYNISAGRFVVVPAGASWTAPAEYAARTEQTATGASATVKRPVYPPKRESAYSRPSDLAASPDIKE